MSLASVVRDLMQPLILARHERCMRDRLLGRGFGLLDILLQVLYLVLQVL